jgi:hypothetical protein
MRRWVKHKVPTHPQNAHALSQLVLVNGIRSTNHRSSAFRRCETAPRPHHNFISTHSAHGALHARHAPGIDELNHFRAPAIARAFGTFNRAANDVAVFGVGVFEHFIDVSRLGGVRRGV